MRYTGGALVVLCAVSMVVAGGKENNPDHYPSIGFGVGQFNSDGEGHNIAFGQQFLESQDFENESLRYWLTTTIPMSQSWSFSAGLVLYDSEYKADETFNWFGAESESDGREIWISFRKYFNSGAVHSDKGSSQR